MEYFVTFMTGVVVVTLVIFVPTLLIMLTSSKVGEAFENGVVLLGGAIFIYVLGVLTRLALDF